MASAPKKHRSLALICLGWTLGAFILNAFAPLLLPYFKAEAALGDSVVKIYHDYKSPNPDPRIVYLVIDQESQTLSGLWDEDFAASPTLQKMKTNVGGNWSREVWADIIERLGTAGASAIVLDLMFPARTPASDPAFAAALEKHRTRVVIGANSEDRTSQGSVTWQFNPPSDTLIPGEARLDPRVGLVNVLPDPDGVVRYSRYRYIEKNSGLEYETIAARALRQAGYAELIPPGATGQLGLYPFHGRTDREQVRTRPIYEIFVPSLWETNYQNGTFFKDKIVVIGPDGAWSKDVVETPFGTISGVELHLNSIHSALTKTFRKQTNQLADLLLITLAALIAFGICVWTNATTLRLILLAPITGAIYLAAVLLYSAGWAIPVLAPILAYSGSVFSHSALLQVQDYMERKRIRSKFDRYVSKDVVAEILDNPNSFLNNLGGARRSAAILFSDVRGFTTATESADPHQLVLQLNEYFTDMVKIVFEHRGTLDKFIGDAVMAHWGSITTRGPEADAAAAVSTALHMLRALPELNKGWIQRGLLDIKIGIGINYGDVITGDLGSDQKAEISVIGDAVNQASRLEGITKTYHLELILGEVVAALVKDAFILRSVALNQAKGKTKPIALYTAIIERQPGQPDPEWLAAYERGILLFRARTFPEALASFEESDRLHPDDWLTQDYIRQTRDLIANPPPADWDAVDRMTSK